MLIKLRWILWVYSQLIYFEKNLLQRISKDIFMINVHGRIENYAGVQCAAMTASLKCFVVVPSVETPNGTKLQLS